jgi:hypothetical protein
VKSQCIKTCLAILLMGEILAAPAAFGNAVRFDFGVNGTTSVTALFQDAGPNQVQLTIAAVGLSTDNYVNSLFFNFNPLFDSQNLVFIQTGSIGGVQGSVGTANDSYKVGGGGKFDINFNFGHAPSFITGNEVTFSVTGISGLSVNDFLFHETASAGHTATYAAGSVQEFSRIEIIPGAPTTTDRQGVPDAGSTSVLLAVGLLGMGLLKRSLRVVQAA